MSQSIWTRCGASSNAKQLRLRAWRVVEGQHRVSTLRLVDSLEEQELLEEMIDGLKPKPPREPEFRGLHYLLATPFRYPPLKRGSRFGTRAERGIWYGSLHDRTALAEVAYYRLVLLEGTTAKIDHVATEHSSFYAEVKTKLGVDLTSEPFARHTSALASKTSYAATQPLGSAMREDGIEAFLYRSARDPDGGENVAVFTPSAFASRRPGPRALPTWHCIATPAQVIFRRRDLLRDSTIAFPRSAFLLNGALPQPAF